MATVSATPSQRYTRFLTATSLSVAVLYLGREILIPLAAAVLFTFLISPLVRLFERCRIGRLVSVLLSVLLIFSALAAGGVGIGWQLNDLASRLPEYKTNLQAKLRRLRVPGGTLEKVENAFQDLSETAESNTGDIQVVRLAPEASLPVDRLRVVAASLVAPGASAGLVVVLVIFMLVSREDLRNRLVRLAGRRLALTTRTLDEIGERISRYLFFNALINGGFGLAVAAGLGLIGVRYAFMWGLVAAFFRFIPYLGPILAATLPVILALVQFPGWLQPLLAIILFLALELVTNNIVEPLVYGHSTGVSTVAILVAAMFWTWVWGPIGLILAVPLTVVLAVVGEHVGPLAPLAILLGDKPPLDPHVTYYQRLLAGDIDEASGILQQRIRATTLAKAFDEIVVPALTLAETDRRAEELFEHDYQQLLQSTRELVEEASPEPSATSEPSTAPAAVDGAPSDRPVLRASVIGLPSRDAVDEMGLWLLRKTFSIHPTGSFEILPVQKLASEMLAVVDDAAPDVVVISCVGQQVAQQTRYLCKRLRQCCPKPTIVVGQWGFTGDKAKMAASIKERGADQVITTLSEADDVLSRVQPVKAAG